MQLWLSSPCRSVFFIMENSFFFQGLVLADEFLTTCHHLAAIEFCCQSTVHAGTAFCHIVHSLFGQAALMQFLALANGSSTRVQKSLTSAALASKSPPAGRLGSPGPHVLLRFQDRSVLINPFLVKLLCEVDCFTFTLFRAWFSWSPQETLHSQVGNSLEVRLCRVCSFELSNFPFRHPALECPIQAGDLLQALRMHL